MQNKTRSGGQHCTMVSLPAALGSIPSVPQTFSEEHIVNVAEVNLLRCLEESGKWPENVDQTHLVLVRGKPVIQKRTRSEGQEFESRRRQGFFSLQKSQLEATATNFVCNHFK